MLEFSALEGWRNIHYDLDAPPLKQGQNQLEIGLVSQEPRQSDAVVPGRVGAHHPLGEEDVKCEL